MITPNVALQNVEHLDKSTQIHSQISSILSVIQIYKTKYTIQWITELTPHNYNYKKSGQEEQYSE